MLYLGLLSLINLKLRLAYYLIFASLILLFNNSRHATTFWRLLQWREKFQLNYNFFRLMFTPSKGYRQYLR